MERVSASREWDADEVVDGDGDVAAEGSKDVDGDGRADAIGIVLVGEDVGADDATDEVASAAGPGGIRSGRRRMPPELTL